MALRRASAPREARWAVVAHCEDAETGPVCADSAVVMTSEVVTNALRHTDGDIRFGVESDSTRVRVEVGDNERTPPSTGAVDDERAEGGRGMRIVAVLASAWGVLPTTLGKIVWFEVKSRP